MIGANCGRNKRDMPEGFAACAWSLTHAELRKRFKAGSAIIRRWRLELDPARCAPSRQAPDDFAELASTMHRAALQRHYDVGEKLVVAWIRETGASPPIAPRAVRACPDDFASLAPTMTRKGLIKHYRTSDVAVVRWIAETGVKPYVRPVPEVSALPKPSGPKPFRFKGEKIVHMDARLHTIYDRAADDLRRKFVVFRCGPTGKFDEKGEHWRVGNVVCTPDELLQRADRCREKAA